MPGTNIEASTKQREALFTKPLLSPGAKKRREGSYDRAEPRQARTLGEDYRAYRWAVEKRQAEQL